MIIGKRREDEIKKLSFEKGVQRLTEGKGSDLHYFLRFCCSELRYCLEPENFSPDNIDLVPLWESENSITGFYWKDNKPIYIRYFIEDIDNYQIIGSSTKELLIDLFRSGIPEEEAEEIGLALSLSQREEIIKEAYDYDIDTLFS